MHHTGILHRKKNTTYVFCINYVCLINIIPCKKLYSQWNRLVQTMILNRSAVLLCLSTRGARSLELKALFSDKFTVEIQFLLKHCHLQLFIFFSTKNKSRMLKRMKRAHQNTHASKRAAINISGKLTAAVSRTIG